MKRGFVLLIFTALAACKAQVNSEIYLTDAIKVAASGTPIQTPMVVAIEIPSQEKCAEATEALLPVLKGAFFEAEHIGCRQIGFDSMAEFKVISEIVLERENKAYDSKMPVYFGVTPADGKTEIALYHNQDATAEMAQKVPDRLSGSRLDRITGAVEIKNDGAEPISLEVSGAFVDGQPVQIAEKFTIERRGTLSVAFSDVANAALSGGGWAIIGNIVPHS